MDLETSLNTKENVTYCYYYTDKFGKEIVSFRSNIEVVMSEMLGNHYFLARKYLLATKELEEALKKQPQNKAIRRKLVICNAQCGELDRALELFISLIEEDIEFITESDPLFDDCPCPELVYDLESQIDSYKNLATSNLKLGIFWLYCDISKSIHYFNEYKKIKPDNPLVTKVLSILNSYLVTRDMI